MYVFSMYVYYVCMYVGLYVCMYYVFCIETLLYLSVCFIRLFVCFLCLYVFVRLNHRHRMKVVFAVVILVSIRKDSY